MFVLLAVYDSGTIFEPQVLDITPEDLRAKFMQVSCIQCQFDSSANRRAIISDGGMPWSVYVQGVQNVAAISLAINYPTAASVAHSIVNSFKNLLAIAAESDVTFKQAEKVRLRKERGT